MQLLPLSGVREEIFLLSVVLVPIIGPSDLPTLTYIQIHRFTLILDPSGLEM
jgi:hypothetical protein